MKKKDEISGLIPFSKAIKMEAEEVRKYLDEQEEEVLEEEYSGEEINALFCRAHDNLYSEDIPLTEPEESHRRQAWIINHYSIISYLHKFITENGRFPTVVELSHKTKLSRVTITKHLKYFERDKYLKFHRQKWKLATENLLNQLYRSAYLNNDSSARLKAAALFLKFADKFLYPINERAESQTNNFIQINNIYITQETIKELPEDKRQAIEMLIIEADEDKLE